MLGTSGRSSHFFFQPSTTPGTSSQKELLQNQKESLQKEKDQLNTQLIDSQTLLIAAIAL